MNDTVKHRPRFAHLLAVTVIVAVSSCGDDEDRPASVPTTLESKVDKPKTAADADAKAEAEPAPPQWSYSPVGKRDPFRSYLTALAAESAVDQPLVDTQKYELDQYRLTGVVTGTARPSAMVEDPEGKGHTLWINSKLGKNGGIVTRIGMLRRSQKGVAVIGIVVTEEIRSQTGDRIRVPLEIPLPQLDTETR
ncbi:MAG: hypothetical protein A2289_15205 [Deltaproteobacteria bacterium RIFOXYA12_FULL_58_15]|nr:MAG: hypothetical protein A2289_15205 [Deltaproteobacteria bacterium RIFOXYA12_FULL_58_15]OGR08956.1 MAG: hypothetical protein A2341_12830 [Deltaproteobacteria bacterium RIFOXYB12_FULL_58_9]